MGFKVALLNCLILLVLFSSASADSIFIKNGDHLSGKVIQLEKNTLIFETDYAGKIAILWGEVATLETEADIYLVLESKSRIIGTIAASESEQISVRIPDMKTPLTISLNQVVGINPTPAGPPVNLTGRVNGGLNISDGNTQTQSVSLDGELVTRSSINRFTIGAIYERQENDGEKTADNASAYIKYDHFLSKKWYALSTVTGTKDDFADLNLRTDFGIGVGYQFWEEKKRNLSFEAGLSYVNEDYIQVEDDNFTAGRWAVTFDHSFGNNPVQFFHNHEGILSIQNSSDLIIRSRTGIRMSVYKSLISTMELRWVWDNSPAEGRQTSDTDYLFSFGYRF